MSESFSFLREVVIPLTMPAIGVSLGFVGSLFLVLRTEWFRRAARWEPYAEALWHRRFEVASDILDKTSRLFRLAIKDLSGEDAPRTKIREIWDPLFAGGPRMLLFGATLNRYLNDYMAKCLQPVGETGEEGAHRLGALWEQNQELIRLFREELNLGTLGKLAERPFEVAELEAEVRRTLVQDPDPRAKGGDA